MFWSESLHIWENPEDVVYVIHLFHKTMLRVKYGSQYSSRKFTNNVHNLNDFYKFLASVIFNFILELKTFSFVTFNLLNK